MPKAHLPETGGMRQSGYIRTRLFGDCPPEHRPPVVEVLLRRPSGHEHRVTVATASVAAARAAALRRHPESHIVSHRTHLPAACTGFEGHGTHVDG